MYFKIWVSENLGKIFVDWNLKIEWKKRILKMLKDKQQAFLKNCILKMSFETKKKNGR